jgi:hypothetical protein
MIATSEVITLLATRSQFPSKRVDEQQNYTSLIVIHVLLLRCKTGVTVDPTTPRDAAATTFVPAFIDGEGGGPGNLVTYGWRS